MRSAFLANRQVLPETALAIADGSPTGAGCSMVADLQAFREIGRRRGIGGDAASEVTAAPRKPSSAPKP